MKHIKTVAIAQRSRSHFKTGSVCHLSLTGTISFYNSLRENKRLITYLYSKNIQNQSRGDNKKKKTQKKNKRK